MDKAKRCAGPAGAAGLLQEVDRICASPEFARAPVMRRLLHFLVAQTLAGHGDELKAYGVAVDGLGRGPDFDPQADSYPRVQVGRLRRMLRQFYDRHGHGPESFEAVIPVGSYRVDAVPAEREAVQDTPPAETESARARWEMGFPLIAATLTLILLAAVMLARERFWRATDRPGPVVALAGPPSIALQPMQPVDGADPQLSRRMDRILNDALHRSWALSVVEDSRPSDYRLTGTLAGTQRRLLYLSLWDMKTRTQIWSDRVDVPVRGRDARAELAPRIAAIMSPFGVIAARERSRLGDDASPGFPCMMRYIRYTANGSREDEPMVRRCLADTLRTDPSYTPAITATIGMGLRQAMDEPGRADAIRRNMLRAARRAIDIEPYSAYAQQALSMAAYANGQCDLGRASGLRSLELNPFEGRAHALIGMFMYPCGDRDYEAHLRMARKLEPTLPAITALPTLMTLADKGQGEAALRLAAALPNGQGRDTPGYDIAMAVAQAAAAERSAADASWRAAAREATGRPDAPPSEVLRRVLPSPALVARTETYLRRRGLFN